MPTDRGDFERRPFCGFNGVQRSFIVGIDDLKGDRGRRPTCEIRDKIDPKVRPGRHSNDRNADTDGRIEYLLRDSADSECPCHRSADRETVKELFRILRRRDVQHDISQCKGE